MHGDGNDGEDRCCGLVVLRDGEKSNGKSPVLRVRLFAAWCDAASTTTTATAVLSGRFYGETQQQQGRRRCVGAGGQALSPTVVVYGSLRRLEVDVNV